MTDVALFEGDAAKKAVGAFRQLAAKKAQGDMLPFLRMVKGVGSWVYGPNEIQADDQRWVIDPRSIKVGYIGWKGGQVVGEQMFPWLSGSRVDPDELEPIVSPKSDDGWSEQMSVEMTSMDDGTKVVYKGSSMGAMDAFAELGEALSTQLENDPGRPVPVIELDNTSYKSKSYGKIFKPIFKIVEWLEPAPATPDKPKRKLV